MTSLTQGAVEPLGVKPRDAERSKNFFALGLVSWMYTRPVADTLSWIEQRFSAKPQVRDAEPRGVQGRPRVRRDGRALRPPVRGRPGAAGPGHLHEHQRQHRAGLGADRRQPAVEAAAVPRLVPDHTGLGHPPRAVEAQALRRAHAAGRGRDRRHRRRGRCRLRRPPGRHHHQRTGHGAEGRGDGTGREPRAAAAHHRHPARRSFHRAAHQDRGRRPPDGVLRPPRRVAPPGHRGEEPERLLLRRHRGGPHRGQVPDAGDPAVRRVPRQRHRAVAAARRDDAARHLDHVRHGVRTTRRRAATRSSGRTSAIPTPSPGRGPCRARRA